MLEHLALLRAQMDWALPLIKKSEIDRIVKENPSVIDMRSKAALAIDDLIEERYRKILDSIKELYAGK
jgi:hypothetical protein